MKKIISALAALTLCFTLAISFAGCNNDDTTIRVGASPTPHAEILEVAKDILAEQGYTLEIVVFDDYVLPNVAVTEGELDANYFQHLPYLNSYNADNNTNIVSAAAIHYEPFGIYGNGVSSLSALANGATILVPSDDSNQTRALFLLAENGIIELKDGASASEGVSILDIKDNKGYNIQAAEASLLPALLNNSDAGTVAVINGNYAIGAGLSISNALATEQADGEAASLYANIIACLPENKDSNKINALIAALQSQEVSDYIDATYNGAVVSMTK